MRATIAVPPGGRMHHLARSASCGRALVRTGTTSLRKRIRCRSAGSLCATVADVPAAVVEPRPGQHTADGPTAKHGNAWHQHQKWQVADASHSCAESTHGDHLRLTARNYTTRDVFRFCVRISYMIFNCFDVGTSG